MSSPRSIEACRRTGIYPNELAKVAYELVEQEVKNTIKKEARLSSPNPSGPKIPGYVNKPRTDETTLKLIDMRIQFYEQRR